MAKISDDLEKEQLLRKYLLGQLSEEEQEQMEDKLFIDKELFQYLGILEHELIDEYIAKKLSKKELTQFESYFLIAPERQQQLKMAIRLNNYADKHQSKLVNERPSLRDRFSGLFRFRPFFATVLIVGLCIGLGVMITEIARLKAELAQLQLAQNKRELLEQDKKNLSQELAQERIRSQQLTQTLTEQQQAQTELARKLAELSQQKESTGKPPIAPSFMTFLLMPGLVRDEEAITTLKIKPQIAEIQLELALEATEYRTYKAELQDQNGQVLWQQANLTENSSKKSVLIKLPAKLVTSSSYRIVLQGSADSKDFEKLGTYYFQITK